VSGNYIVWFLDCRLSTQAMLNPLICAFGYQITRPVFGPFFPILVVPLKNHLNIVLKQTIRHSGHEQLYT
jgi:hypothetical protein